LRGRGLPWLIVGGGEFVEAGIEHVCVDWW
jgi:hypothetical protein